MTKDELKFVATLPNKINKDGDVLLSPREASRLISLIHKLDKTVRNKEDWSKAFQKDLDRFTQKWGKG